MIGNREDAIYDCKSILEYSETALHAHFSIWNNTTDVLDENDALYSLTLKEIEAKLHTTECLLKDNLNV